MYVVIRWEGRTFNGDVYVLEEGGGPWLVFLGRVDGPA